MVFKFLPQVKIKWGWGLEISEATLRDLDDQSNDLKTTYLTNGARRYRALMRAKLLNIFLKAHKSTTQAGGTIHTKFRWSLSNGQLFVT